jgi:hypothetical protein
LAYDEQLREHVASLLSVVAVGCCDDGELAEVDIGTVELQRRENMVLITNRIAEANEQWPVRVFEAVMSTTEGAWDEVHQYDAVARYEGLSISEGPVSDTTKERSE